jgi:hypothetical protein
MPELFIITGSNGAGKSSIGPEYLPTHIRQQGPIFDGDKLFVEKRKDLLNQHYEMFQTVQIIDTSEAEHAVLAVLADGKPANAVPSKMLPSWFQHHLPSITQKIRDGEPKFF